MRGICGPLCTVSNRKSQGDWLLWVKSSVLDVLLPCTDQSMIDSLLLAAARVSTFEQKRHLTNAGSFFFQRGERRFLGASRHAMAGKASKHLSSTTPKPAPRFWPSGFRSA